MRAHETRFAWKLNRSLWSLKIIIKILISIFIKKFSGGGWVLRRTRGVHSALFKRGCHVQYVALLTQPLPIPAWELLEYCAAHAAFIPHSSSEAAMSGMLRC